MGIDLAYYLIGATAEAHNLELGTLSIRRFPAFPTEAPLSEGLGPGARR